MRQNFRNIGFQGFDQEEIDAKVSDYRKLLLSQLESGELNLDDEVSNNDSHTRRKMAADVSRLFVILKK